MRDPQGIELGRGWSAAQLCDLFGGELDAGARTVRVSRVVSPEHASRADDLVVVTRAELARCAGEQPGLSLCLPDVAPRLPEGRRWLHPHVMWVVAKLLQGVGSPAVVPGISPRALVCEGAQVDPSAEVRAGAVVLPGATIGPGCVVGEGAVIHGGVRLGARVVVGPNAVLGRPGFGFAVGPDGDTVRVPQLGGVVLEDDAEVGALSTIDSGTLGPTVVRRGAKLDAHVHVGHNVEIGEYSFVAAQSGFAGSARLGARVLVGGQVGVADHIVVGEGARLAARSGVIRDVPARAVVAGYPAVPRGDWLRVWARLLRGLRAGDAPTPEGAARAGDGGKKAEG